LRLTVKSVYPLPSLLKLSRCRRAVAAFKSCKGGAQVDMGGRYYRYD
jgi:hypothetical protein